MKCETTGSPAFSQMEVSLDAGESFMSEAGAMVRMSARITMDVTTRSKGKGGIMGGLKRLVSGDSFFLSNYTASGGPGEVVLAPTHMGQVRAIDLDGTSAWLCAGGSYLGNGPGLGIETKWQGMKGLFTGESLFFMEATGSGPLIVNAFGQLNELDVDGAYVVDSGHVVAFETSLDYEITKAGSSWIQSFFAGEGVVMNFKGRGKLLVQSHNPTEFGKAVGPQLPPRA